MIIAIFCLSLIVVNSIALLFFTGLFRMGMGKQKIDGEAFPLRRQFFCKFSASPSILF